MTELVSQTPGASADPAGYDASRFNAVRHGVLSRFTILPWEDEAEYEQLVEALTREHTPAGLTEMHLVIELAGVLWRKRRLRLAETAAHRRGLKDALVPYRETAKAALAHLGAGEQVERASDAVRTTEAATAEWSADLLEDKQLTLRALELLSAQRNDAYELALRTLRQDTQDWWVRELKRDPSELDDDDQPATPDVAGLRRFIEGQVLPWFDAREKELLHRPLIRAQALGESLDPDKLERLGRYEVHLDRKLERTLSTLIRLQELRRTKPPAAVQA
jgi:hypothetical protein